MAFASFKFKLLPERRLEQWIIVTVVAICKHRTTSVYASHALVVCCASSEDRFRERSIVVTMFLVVSLRFYDGIRIRVFPRVISDENVRVR